MPSGGGKGRGVNIVLSGWVYNRRGERSATSCGVGAGTVTVNLSIYALTWSVGSLGGKGRSNHGKTYIISNCSILSLTPHTI